MTDNRSSPETELVNRVADAINDAVAQWQPGSPQRIKEMAARAAIEAVRLAQCAPEPAGLPTLDEYRNNLVEECAMCVPTTWLDPLLTGPNAVLGDFNAPNVEGLLQAIAARIRALSIPSPQGNSK